MHAVAFEVEIRIPDSHSLKDRRQVVRSMLAVARGRFHVSAAEVGGQDTGSEPRSGSRSSPSEARLAEETLDEIDRYLWSRPEIEVLDCTLAGSTVSTHGSRACGVSVVSGAAR